MLFGGWNGAELRFDGVKSALTWELFIGMGLKLYELGWLGGLKDLEGSKVDDWGLNSEILRSEEAALNGFSSAALFGALLFTIG